MDDALAQLIHSYKMERKWVLILVVMDDALAQKINLMEKKFVFES